MKTWNVKRTPWKRPKQATAPRARRPAPSSGISAEPKRKKRRISPTQASSQPAPENFELDQISDKLDANRSTEAAAIARVDRLALRVRSGRTAATMMALRDTSLLGPCPHDLPLARELPPKRGLQGRVGDAWVLILETFRFRGNLKCDVATLILTRRPPAKIQGITHELDFMSVKTVAADAVTHVGFYFAIASCARTKVCLGLSTHMSCI